MSQRKEATSKKGASSAEPLGHRLSPPLPPTLVTLLAQATALSEPCSQPSPACQELRGTAAMLNEREGGLKKRVCRNAVSGVVGGGGARPNTTTYTQDGGTNGHVFAIRLLNRKTQQDGIQERSGWDEGGN